MAGFFPPVNYSFDKLQNRSESFKVFLKIYVNFYKYEFLNTTCNNYTIQTIKFDFYSIY